MISYRSNAGAEPPAPAETPAEEAETRPPTIASIREAVCSHYHLPAIAMVAERRSVAWARPRQIAMYLAAEMTPHSLITIGKHFGGRDHTTVMHAGRRIADLRGTDMRLDADVRALTALLSRSAAAFHQALDSYSRNGGKG